MSHFEFLIISSLTPTLSWLPFTHIIKCHNAETDEFLIIFVLFLGCAFRYSFSYLVQLQWAFEKTERGDRNTDRLVQVLFYGEKNKS